MACSCYRYRLIRHEVAAITLHDLLVLLVRAPTNSACVVVFDKDFCLLRWQRPTLAPYYLTLLHDHFGGPAAIHIGPGVKRVMQHTGDGSRFLLMRYVDEAALGQELTHLVAVDNWFEELNRLALPDPQ